MYDLAREQSPTLDHLRTFCALTRDAGYDAIGLYLEHRFAYPSTPWSHGKGVVTPEMVQCLEQEFPEIQIIPFVNLLGHFEGFMYAEGGRQFAEQKFKGLQACPSKPDFVSLARGIVDDVLATFSSNIIHIGGDETWQLGQCPVCSSRVKEYEKTEGVDGKAQIYGEHFGVFAKYLVEKERRPAVWGDMFFDHPTALKEVPKETLIFDWQYFKSPQVSSKLFHEAGFDVVYAPTIHTYNSVWMHLAQSEQNLREHIRAAEENNAYGVCLTTWECGLFGNYETLLPVIRAGATATSSVSVLENYDALTEAPDFLRSYLKEGERHEDWARLMGIELQAAGGIFKYSGTRSGIKVRLLLYSNPFLCWLHHGEELCGEVGTKALATLERAISVAPDVAYRGVSEFVRLAIDFVRYAEDAHRFYAAGVPGEAAAALMPCRQVFENLAKIAKSTHLRIGGSLADIERCLVAQRHVELVIRRIKDYGDGSLGYLPSFETLTHPKFMPHDQANWWLINSWANE